MKSLKISVLKRILRDVAQGYSVSYFKDKRIYIRHLGLIDQVDIDDVKDKYYLFQDHMSMYEEFSDLKKYLVDYVDQRLENEQVTVNMIAEVLAADFPEFTYAFAEENFIRGYNQALFDVDEGNRAMQELEEQQTNDQD